MAHPMFVKHQDLLGTAVHAIGSRNCWCPYAEDVAAYGENAVAAGREAFEAYPDAQFYLDQPGVVGRGGGEVSPYGFDLNVSYPKCSADALIAAGKTAMPAWIKAGPDVRAGVCAEILARLNAHSLEIAHAVMHTTGQALGQAFLGGGPRAQARGLEAVACAWREMKLVPYRATWEKPQGGNPPLRLEKRYAVVPRGVALTIAGAVAPTWHSYPGIFASLATGNAVIVKPHPAAILPLAITVAVARQTLKDAGFDANLASLLVDTLDVPVAKDVAFKPDIRIIDYTGASDFGRWLRDNAHQAVVFAAAAGVNCVVVDSSDDYVGMLKNLAFALAIDAGQTSTTPRAIFVAAEGELPAERFSHDLATAVGKLLDDPVRAVNVLGAIRSPAILARLEAAALGDVVRASTAIAHPQWPQAAVRTPLLLKTTSQDPETWREAGVGPVSFIVATRTTAESLAIAERAMRESGALTLSVHSTNPRIVELAEEAAARVGAVLAINFTGAGCSVQPEAFSDYQGGIVDGAFVCNRFAVVQTSRPAA